MTTFTGQAAAGIQLRAPYSPLQMPPPPPPLPSPWTITGNTGFESLESTVADIDLTEVFDAIVGPGQTSDLIGDEDDVVIP